MFASLVALADIQKRKTMTFIQHVFTQPVERVPSGTRMTLAALPIIGLGAGFLVAKIVAKPVASNIDELKALLVSGDVAAIREFVTGYGFSMNNVPSPEIFFERVNSVFKSDVFLGSLAGFFLGGLLLVTGIAAVSGRKSR
tara:strand:- start:12100 stop:12522 length:423 start_codon:yes stop_codon:yes gene_type:complete